jgi:hypothetical protein
MTPGAKAFREGDEEEHPKAGIALQTLKMKLADLLYQ